VFAPAQARGQGAHQVLHTPLGDLQDVAQDLPVQPLPDDGACEVLLRADDIVHDDDAPVKAEILRKAFRGSEFLYTLRLASGQVLMAHVPSHHDHHVGEWIGIRLQADHVVVFGANSASTL
jgi:iron(III) transport system ATP-binding protein